MDIPKFLLEKAEAIAGNGKMMEVDNKPVTLKCMCCGHIETFANAIEAYNIGWDCPPFFTQIVCCNLCPGSFVAMGCTEKHAKAHERWRAEGRPKDWEAPEE